MFLGWLKGLRGVKSELYALYLACRDPRTPWYAKALAAGVVGYALSPVDLVPDFVPVLGMLDDAVLVPLGLMLVRRMIPCEVMQDARERAARAAWLKPRNWIAAGVVLLLWLSMLVVLALLAWRWLA